MLVLTETGSRHEVRIWISEALESKALLHLVKQIGILIEAYTGQKPALN